MPIGGNIVGSGPPAELWTVEYELDLTAQTAHDFTPGGDGSTLSMGGVTWTAYNASSANKFETTSSGLEIDPKGDGSHLWAQNQDLPYLAAKLDDMMTSLGEDDTLCLQLHMDSSPVVSEAWDAYGLALWNGADPEPHPNPTSEYLAHRWVMDLAGPDKRAETFVETAVAPLGFDSPIQTTPQSFFEIVLYPGNGAVSNMGAFGSAFPDPLTTSAFKTYASISGSLGPGGGYTNPVPTWKIARAEARFMIHAQRASSTTVLTTTSYKMRVLRRKGD